MSKKQTLSLRQAANNTTDIPLATLHRYSPSKLFARIITTLEVKSVAFWSYPYTGGTNSCFLKPSLRWRYKQLLCKSTPYPGVTNSKLLNQQYHAAGTSLRWWYWCRRPVLHVMFVCKRLFCLNQNILNFSLLY